MKSAISLIFALLSNAGGAAPEVELVRTPMLYARSTDGGTSFEP